MSKMLAKMEVEEPRLTARQVEANMLMAGPQAHTLLRGGSRSGKTFLFCRGIAKRALRASGSRHMIWRFHYNHAKNSVGLDTFPKMMKLWFPEVVERMGGVVSFNNEGRLILPNKSEVWLGGLDDKERVEKILGMEFATNFFNEASQIPYHAVEMAHSRLAQRVMIDAIGDPMLGELLPLRNWYDMNPPGKRHWSHDVFKKHLVPGTKEPIADPDDYREMQINPKDNLDFLPPQYFKTLAGMSKAKRVRFEAGEWANDAAGSLWTSDMLDQARIGVMPAGVTRVRTVIGVDPSGSAGDKFSDEPLGSNDIGIVVACLGSDGLGYVLEDATLNGSPAEWGERVVKAAHQWGADRVIAERNFGGAMVEFVLRSASRSLPVKMTTSSRGKALRAEPVSALYEPNQRKVKHVGYFGELEEQMTAMMAQPHGFQGDGSPDRLDAAVFAINELMLGGTYSLDNLD